MLSTKKLAVIGNPIDHSLSPQIHSLFAKELDLDISYEAIKVNQQNFKSKVDSLFEAGYLGLNVTLPLKELAFDYANKLSAESELWGSVNTIWKEDSILCADTTDGRGLLRDLRDKDIEVQDKQIMLLGAGGSARAIIPSLLQEGPAKLTIANRTPSRASDLADKFPSHEGLINIVELSKDLDFVPDIIINSTSAGVLEEKIEFPRNLFSKGSDVSWKQLRNTYDLKSPAAMVGKLRNEGMMIYENRSSKGVSYRVGTPSKAVIAAGITAVFGKQVAYSA